jgi:integrase
MRRGIREGTVTLKNLYTVRRGSAVYRYIRIKGRPLIALPDLPIDSPKFLAAYSAAMEQVKPSAATGTIRAAIIALRCSDRYLSASPAYRAIMARNLEAISTTAKTAKLAHLEARHIRADISTLSPNPAGQRLKAWRMLCAFATETGLVDADPSNGVKSPRAPKSDGHPPWTAEDIAQFRARWPIGTTPRAAMELLHWTGARISDAVRIGPQHIGRDGVLSFEQKKTGGRAYVPWSCALPSFAANGDPDRQMMLDAIAHMTGHLTFLATSTGRTRTATGLGNTIAKSCTDAKLPELSAHGLRKSRAIALAEAGATPHQIGAWTGHSSLSEIAHYTRAVDRRAMVIGTEQDQNDEKQHDQSEKRAK